MSKSSQLTKRQLAVIEDLFASELDEREVLEKHGVKPDVYRKWLADEQFMEHFERRIEQAYHAGRVILARNAPRAATKLVNLTQCDKEEVVRRACLDIIFPQTPNAEGRASSHDTPEARPTSDLSPEAASHILAALAGPPQEKTESPLC